MPSRWFVIGTLVLLWASQPAPCQWIPWEESIAAGEKALDEGQFNAAAQQFRAAVQEAERFGPEDARLARSLQGLASSYFALRDYAGAEGFYLRALEIRVKALGEDHQDVGQTLGGLAVLYEVLHRLPEAAALYENALAIREHGAAADDLELARILENYARLQSKTGRQEDADRLLERARPIRNKRIAKLLQRAEPVRMDALSVGGSVMPPRLASRVNPEYSPEARVAKHQGMVELSVEVGPDGVVHNVELRRNLGLGLDEKAVEAVRQWRFEPGTKGGIPVTVKALVTVNFRLL